MTRVYFLNPPFIDGFVRCGRWQGARARGRTLYYPIWLSYASAVAERSGVDVRLVDAIASRTSRQEVLADILRFQPDILVVDTNFSSLAHDTEFSSEAKMRASHEMTTIAVGPPASVFSERIVAEYGVDIAARNEYDYTAVEVAEALDGRRSLRSIMGISYLDEGSVVHNPDRPFLSSDELDDLPFVSQTYKKHLRPEDYWLDHTLNPMVQIITSRGCPHLCTFCSWPRNFMGRRFRARSVDNIVREMKWIEYNMPEVREVFLEDDTFTTDLSRVHNLCSERMRVGLRTPWSCQTRANLSLDTLRLMKDAGCRLVDVGFESGSNTVLKNIRKGIYTAEMKRFADDVKRARLLLLGDFVIGFPGETQDTINKTRELIRSVKPHILQVAIATPIPGTEFYEWCASQGVLTETDPGKTIDEQGFQKCLVSYPDLSADDLEHHVKKTLLDYYLSPSYVSALLDMLFRRNGTSELVRTIQSAKDALDYFKT